MSDPRDAVVAAARAMSAAGLNTGAAGNVSLRVGDGFWITPSGLVPEAMTPDTLAWVGPEGWDGRGAKPSSEWELHQAVLAARPDLNGVIHTHAPFCTTLACHDRGIPAFHYMIALFGGTDVPCAPYATFGTPALARAAAEALRERLGCLLSHHGMLVAGRDLDHAHHLALELEGLAEVYWRAVHLGPPPLIDAAEMARVLEKFKTYGQRG